MILAAPTLPAPAPLALTMGEPGGIGAEISVAAWRALRGTGPAFVLIDDPARLAALHPDCPLAVVRRPAEAADAFAEALPVLPLDASVPAGLGRADPATAGAVIESLERAVALVAAGEAAAVVTNPIQKSALYAAGFRHPGHTEFLAALTGAPRPVMMIASAALRVVPATIHIPLADVPRSLDAGLLDETIAIVAAALAADFALLEPRIAVAGLNPHAGEGGALGSEDDRIIAPAIARARAKGHAVRGPLPADTMFHERARATYDAALCMYHDQALIPVKTLDFDRGVNVTLGLPIVRTSPDHGTALDIAGRGLARRDSLVAALELAATLAGNRRRAQEARP